MANPGAILKHFAAIEVAEMRYAEAVEPLKPGLPLRSRFGDGDKWIDEYADGRVQTRFGSDGTMSSKAIIKTGSGEVLTLDVAKPVTLTAGQAVTIAVTPASAVGVVQFYDFSGPKPVNLGYANKAPYELKWTVPADRPSRVLGVALALHNRATEPTLHYPIVVRPGPTSTPSTGDGNEPAAVHKFGWGFVASEKDNLDTLKVCMTRAKADGATWIRIWHTGFGAISAENIAIVNMAVSIGLKVILCVNVKDGQARNLGTPDVTGFATKNRDILAKITFIEAGNELNLSQFRPDDLGSNWSGYVTRWLAPLNAAVPGKVLCTSITDTWNPKTYVSAYTSLKAAGAFEHCVGVAIHLYPTPRYAAEMFDAVKQVKALADGLPLIVSECNVHAEECPDDAAFKVQFAVLAESLRGQVDVATIYRSVPNSIQSRFTGFDGMGHPTAAYAVMLLAVG